MTFSLCQLYAGSQMFAELKISQMIDDTLGNYKVLQLYQLNFLFCLKDYASTCQVVNFRIYFECF